MAGCWPLQRLFLQPQVMAVRRMRVTDSSPWLGLPTHFKAALGLALHPLMDVGSALVRVRLIRTGCPLVFWESFFPSAGVICIFKATGSSKELWTMREYSGARGGSSPQLTSRRTTVPFKRNSRWMANV